jgi:hypothetical protein
MMKRCLTVGCQWFTPIILGTWKAEIRKILVTDQTGKKFARPYLQNIQSKVDWLEQ